VMIFFVVLSIYLLSARRSALAGVAAALSVMTKGTSIILMPILAGRRPVKFAATALAAAVILWIPYVSAGARIFDGASAYTRFWRFNDGAFYVLYSMEQAFRRVEYVPAPFAKATAAVLLVLYLVFTVRKTSDKTADTLTACRNVTVATLLLMPVVDPWYVCWLVPFLCGAPNLGMLALCALCPISYAYYADNSFPAWLRFVEYAPVFIGLLWEMRRRRKCEV
jgi:alpha-1,6-mannosyltransferase